MQGLYLSCQSMRELRSVRPGPLPGKPEPVHALRGTAEADPPGDEGCRLPWGQEAGEDIASASHGGRRLSLAGRAGPCQGRLNAQVHPAPGLGLVFSPGLRRWHDLAIRALCQQEGHEGVSPGTRWRTLGCSRPPGSPLPSYLQPQLGLRARTGLPLPPPLPAVSPALGAWCGGGWPLPADPVGCRGWGAGLTSQGLLFFFFFPLSLAAKCLSFSKYYS